ncbi:UDP-2,4-diacetamido-2,4,6-trideoxy-beta-L-altropyranose hydrolase [Dechloromonas denitrificans]|uniref:UDP-2,4-diacetamido-2,4, 6-trideoxy-beta-L-altropyranose hydrolase n=1 Tax=Dechloromonas denitrificans TaxID=281362 RepID=UPI001CF82847|nr:UDP-2,4-diacetamido-2,4,6-trideoxy-beta-L-altropyranose hydrolase [Dechloromonas denitrificans]UCV10585.1 UDP-2,4-diacetamido-2,4,6-trideoxy-beta-L-altropyranose hydrolase [Dechloromonas denitrificans]
MRGMRILIRTDASVKIGSGHLMRCLTLADQLVGAGAEVAFVCRDLPGAMFDLLSMRGFRFAKLPSVEDGCVSQQRDAAETTEAIGQLYSDRLDWLIVDHYLLDASWEQLLRPCTRKIMVIDDLADRSHDCELLLDQNYYHGFERRYDELLPPQCVSLLGPGYVLLRPEFADAKKQLIFRDGIVKRILVFFGATDPCMQTQKVIEAFKQLSRPDITVDIVVGQTNPFCHAIQACCADFRNINFHCQVSNMAELILKADLGIGAGGAAMWERCYLGLPTITVVFADNQLRTTEDVADVGAIEYLGQSDLFSADDYMIAIMKMIENPTHVRNMSRAALGVLDIKGQNIIDVMRRIIP